MDGRGSGGGALMAGNGERREERKKERRRGGGVCPPVHTRRTWARVPAEAEILLMQTDGTFHGIRKKTERETICFHGALDEDLFSG